MKFTIKALLASVILGAGVSFTSCNNAEPEINDNDAVILRSVEVGSSFSFQKGSNYACNNTFVGDIVDNRFTGMHVGTCIVKNYDKEYRIDVTTANTVIAPVTEWGISQEELIDELGEELCEVDGDKVVYKPNESKPVEKYVYNFVSGKLYSLSMVYVVDATNTDNKLTDYLLAYYNVEKKGTEEEPVNLYYNANTPAEATVFVTQTVNAAAKPSGWDLVFSSVKPDNL